MVKRFVLVAVAAALFGAGVTSAVMLFKPSLDRTEKWFSIAGVVVSTGFGIMTLPFLRRRTAETEAPAAPPPGSQSVTGCVVGGEIVQVRGVRGNVRIGPAG